MVRVSKEHTRPLSPNIQAYRPQLTSVLSIANRITGVVLSIGAVVLVTWLAATASGQVAYYRFQGLIDSWPGQILLLGGMFAFYFHFFGGIRHLVWDTVRGFELRQIYVSGWLVVLASTVLTLTTWIATQAITR